MRTSHLTVAIVGVDNEHVVYSLKKISMVFSP
jgi:hypothetical protein